MTGKEKNEYFYTLMIGKKKSRTRSIINRGIILLEIAILVPVFLLLISNQVIRITAESHLFDSAESVPYNRVALVLGTSHRMRDGGPNPYFHNRMEAAAHLYHSGKVRYILVSGDNRTRYYDEPGRMRDALLELDVPPDVIYMDHAGLRTLDSVLRAKEIFGLDSMTIVSQRFHNQRAVYIAKQHGIEVAAYNARDVPSHRNDKTRMREWFAKANVFWDIISGTQPQLPGEEVNIGEQAR